MFKINKSYIYGPALAVALLLGIVGCQESDINKKAKDGSKTAASAEAAKKPASADAPLKPRFPYATGDVKGSSEDIKAYVTRYYEAYKAKDWNTGYALIPESSRTTQTIDEFIGRRATAPLESFEVKKPFVQASGDIATVYVLYTIQHYGDWISSWDFKKEGNEWVPLSFQSTVR